MGGYADIYNTILNPIEESLYKQWLFTLPEYQRNTNDYDLRGYAKENGFEPRAEGHFPDKYKKPNHPTFSNESIYHGYGGHFGGFWGNVNGKDYFFPSEWNEQFLDGYDDPTALIMR